MTMMSMYFIVPPCGNVIYKLVLTESKSYSSTDLMYVAHSISE